MLLITTTSTILINIKNMVGKSMLPTLIWICVEIVIATGSAKVYIQSIVFCFLDPRGAGRFCGMIVANGGLGSESWPPRSAQKSFPKVGLSDTERKVFCGSDDDGDLHTIMVHPVDCSLVETTGKDVGLENNRQIYTYIR